MRFASNAIALVVMVAAIALHGPKGFAQWSHLGVVGRMVAVERVIEDECDDFRDDGRCAFVAIQRALDRLSGYLDHFRCVSASGKPRVSLAPAYEPFTDHDPGPVVMVEARDIRCSRDPRHELMLIDYNALGKTCSRLEWKCSMVWVPDYDQSIAFIGEFGSLRAASDF
jgi:hypothetical protein